MQKALNIVRLRTLIGRYSAFSKQWRSFSSTSKQFAVQSSSLNPSKLVNSSSLKGITSFVRNYAEEAVSEVEDFSPRQLSDYLKENEPTDTWKEPEETYNAAIAEGKVEMRFLIPEKIVDLLAAEKEQLVDSFREKFGAEMVLLDWKQPQGIIRITCPQDKISECIEEILPKISIPSGENKQVRLIMHVSISRRTVGLGGKQRRTILKELKMKPATWRHGRQRVAKSTDMVHVYTADEEKLHKLVNNIVGKFHEFPIKCPQVPISSDSYVPSLVDDYAGFAEKSSILKDPVVGSLDGLITEKVKIPVELFDKLEGDLEYCVKSLRHKSGASLRIKNPQKKRSHTALTISGLSMEVERAFFVLKKGLEKSEEGKAYLRGEYETVKEADEI